MLIFNRNDSLYTIRKKWLMPRTPIQRSRVGAPLGSNRVVSLSKAHFTPQKVLVIPRKRWLRPNMTEKLFTGTLRINQPTNQLSEKVFRLQIVMLPGREYIVATLSVCLSFIPSHFCPENICFAN